MTEIVQNNNSMKFDLLETGNSSSSGPDSDNLFNNLLGSVDIKNTDHGQDNQVSVDEELRAAHWDREVGPSARLRLLAPRRAIRLGLALQRALLFARGHCA